MGGDKGAEEFRAKLQKELGEKGYEGIDLNRPIVGYVHIPADLKKTVTVVAFPITGEKEFLDLVKRLYKAELKDLGKGLYDLPVGEREPDVKIKVRIVEDYAYAASGLGEAPTAALDKNAIVPATSLYDPPRGARYSRGSTSTGCRRSSGRTSRGPSPRPRKRSKSCRSPAPPGLGM